MSKAVNNPFAMFATGTKKAVINALGGAEIEYRELTMAEDDAFQQSIIKGLDDDGKPQLDMEKYAELKYHKVAAVLVEPKMTVDELKALPKSAQPAIAEILTLISGEDESETEGN